jgi:hypothetical protein
MRIPVAQEAAFARDGSQSPPAIVQSLEGSPHLPIALLANSAMVEQLWLRRYAACMGIAGNAVSPVIRAAGSTAWLRKGADSVGTTPEFLDSETSSTSNARVAPVEWESTHNQARRTKGSTMVTDDLQPQTTPAYRTVTIVAGPDAATLRQIRQILRDGHVISIAVKLSVLENGADMLDDHGKPTGMLVGAPCTRYVQVTRVDSDSDGYIPFSGSGERGAHFDARLPVEPGAPWELRTLTQRTR